MAAPGTAARTARPDWTVMTAIHQALRRDLDQLLHTTASTAAARARWQLFSRQLRYHLATEHARIWQPAAARLAGHPEAQALLEAMHDEHQLIGPLHAVTDDAYTMHADPARLRWLLTRLQTRLLSHLAHEETSALPLISQTMTRRELAAISTALRGGHHPRRAATTLPWALAGAAPDTRRHTLSQLPRATRLAHRALWQPRHSRIAPSL